MDLHGYGGQLDRECRTCRTRNPLTSSHPRFSTRATHRETQDSVSHYQNTSSLHVVPLLASVAPSRMETHAHTSLQFSPFLHTYTHTHFQPIDPIFLNVWTVTMKRNWLAVSVVSCILCLFSDSLVQKWGRGALFLPAVPLVACPHCPLLTWLHYCNHQCLPA